MQQSKGKIRQKKGLQSINTFFICISTSDHKSIYLYHDFCITIQLILFKSQMSNCFFSEQVSQDSSLFRQLYQPQVSNGEIYFPLVHYPNFSQLNLGDTNISSTIRSQPKITTKLSQKRHIKKDHPKIDKKKLTQITEKGSDYKKNICGYVTKKIMRELVNESYQYKVRQLCEVEKIGLSSVKDFYSPKIERVTGPSHIPPLLTPTCKQEVTIMKVFYNFFMWFLYERYLRHLFIQGKMQWKRAYIEYKNRELIPMLEELSKQLLETKEQNLYLNTQVELNLYQL